MSDNQYAILSIKSNPVALLSIESQEWITSEDLKGVFRFVDTSPGISNLFIEDPQQISVILFSDYTISFKLGQPLNLQIKGIFAHLNLTKAKNYKLTPEVFEITL